ncbi:MAG: acyltransferase [Oscillospiraceae bacterium]|jgi:peptidoglycan/LPS O-acetylase OafA/YrhL|nr:acyltransferase [Oscillospiraceae bacterium]
MLKSKQIQGLDSLRALGVILVLMYHLFPVYFPGGFLGVDIFFAFSGYLITALLIQEFRNKHHIALVDFYRRRVRRLLPAMAGMLGVSLSASLLISSDFRVGIRRQAAAVLGFVTNYFEISGGKSYEDAQLPHMFVHTWTLSVEMHFYLIWAAVIAIVFFCLRKKEPGSALFHARRILTWLAMLLAGGSYLLMRMMTRGVAGGEDPSAGYFATHAHFFPIMLGALTALHFGYRTKPVWEKVAAGRRFRALCIGVLALGTAALTAMSLRPQLSEEAQTHGWGRLLSSLCLSFSDAKTYSWGLLLSSVIVCLMIIAVRLLQETKPLRELKILVWLGTRSFGIYLYHWPLLIIFQQLFQDLRNDAVVWAAPLATLIFTMPLAEISFRLVENKFRSGKKKKAETMEYTDYLERKPVNKRAIAAVLAVLILLASSGTALATAPQITSLERELTKERRLLDAEYFQQVNDQFEKLKGSPVDSYEYAVQKPNGPSTYNPTAPDQKKYSGGVTMIGDSVMLGAATTLRSTIVGVTVDAVVSRNMRKGISVVDNYLAEGKLGKNFVLGLSTNIVPASASDLREILDNLKGKGYHVVLITGYGGTGGTLAGIKKFAEYLRTVPDDYDFVVVADWGAYAESHKNLLTADNIHLKDGDSRRAYVKVITTALDTVQSKPVS